MTHAPARSLDCSRARSAGFAALLRSLAGALLLLAGAHAADAPQRAPASPPPAELFYKVPELDAAVLSPSGRWLAVRTRHGRDRMSLAVFDLDGKTAPAVAAELTNADVGDFAWVGDDRLVFDVDDLQSAAGDSSWHTRGVFSVRRDGKEFPLVGQDASYVRERRTQRPRAARAEPPAAARARRRRR